MMGRSVVGAVGGGFGSLTANMVASKTCGSTVIVTWPSLVMLSFGGLFGSSITTPLRFVGLDQYFSNMPSLVHFWRDRKSDSARTPLTSVSDARGTCGAGREHTFPSHSDSLYWRGPLAGASRPSAEVC